MAPPLDQTFVPTHRQPLAMDDLGLQDFPAGLSLLSLTLAATTETVRVWECLPYPQFNRYPCPHAGHVPLDCVQPDSAFYIAPLAEDS